MKNCDKNSSYKSDLLDHLSKTSFMDHNNPNFFHGRIYRRSNPPAPRETWKSSDPPRFDHDAPNWLTATEYTDTDSVFQDKIEWLVTLLKNSSKTVVYTGAGISTAAGVEQAANGGKNKRGGCSTDAQPTLTHRALAALQAEGLVHSWIQQNHDGLPQKAGYPQEDIVEIHGSWYDPSNPVVCYDGNLKQEYFQRIEGGADSADLVLVLGTSLSGLNSDRVAKDPAKRSLHGKSLGTVIINLQQTQQDGISSLRIFSPTDQVFSALLDKLGLALKPCPSVRPSSRVLIPYDKTGKYSPTQSMWLDLSPGVAIRYRDTLRQAGPGHGKVVSYSNTQGGWVLEVEGVQMLLGGWWLAAAARGKLGFVPVINIE